MDYEQKYKDTIERAKKELQTCGSMECDAAKQLFRLFPELKEIKDEKIRKALISAINNICAGDEGLVTFNGFSKEQVLAWLEKQGKHANFRNKIQIGDKVTRNDNGELVNLSQLERVAKKLEKQEEQKPVEEYNITGIGSKNAQGKLGEMIKNLKPVNEVLEQKSADKVEPKFKVKYAGSEYNVLEVKDIAGVTFYGIEDEPNHIDYVKADNCEIISGYGIKENGSPYPTKPSMFSEQKPAWSEEDENYLQSAENACEYQYGKNTSTILWLKSLKDRIICKNTI